MATHKRTFTVEENQDVKFLLIIIGTFAKMQHFQSNLLKIYLEMIMKMQDNAMVDYRPPHEDYWMKTLRTVYHYGLHDRTNFMKNIVP